MSSSTAGQRSNGSRGDAGDGDVEGREGGEGQGKMRGRRSADDVTSGRDRLGSTLPDRMALVVVAGQGTHEGATAVLESWGRRCVFA